ncbi:CD276 antigen isoform X2 [Pleuronectes platessa]|uniref:CD276 antigen isoform X2 n=1 Tax=Pleuronectes platessa TaxID=8262 RepID=UPI00232A32FF|nr:CD276 antigen isoform X2 [Pleuronectes platessa]
MSAFRSLVVLILIMWTLTTADVEVSCVLEESCFLPCSFHPGKDPVIHWKQVEPGNTFVHSYYRASDQFDHQNESFRGRTSLFTDQISGGNASIRLTGLQLQDQGRYLCFTSIIDGDGEESFINLTAEAPVRHVDIEQVEDSFTCRSEGIYPEPQLTWSTRPPSNVTLQNQTSVKETEQQLYEISSTVTLSDRDSVLICSISTRSGRRSAVWYQPTPVHVSPNETTTTINCTAPNTKPPTHLLWKFNHSQIIVNQTGVDGPPRVSEQWRQQVEDVSASGSLTLHHLSSDHQGTFTCELSSEEETLFINSYVTIEEAPVRHVDIEQVEDSFTCRSEGIYPEPQLTWSTRPPSNVTLQNQTSVKETEQQLYEISSTVTLSDRDSVLICSISTRSGRRSAVWYQPTPVHVSPSETTTTINCTAPNTKPPTHWVWKFNHRQIIVNQTGVDGLHSVSEQWRQQVEDVSASGSLTLHHLSSDHQGTFTCELSSEEETLFINSYVTIEEGSSGAVAGIVVGVLVVCVALGAGFYYCIRLKRNEMDHPPPDPTEMNHLQSDNEGNNENTTPEGDT